ncbi:MAG: radical SAM-associated putative lipoprotein [Alistipes sp.]|nr:radical SAM-associated putative lipoprotein [Alistipes senegalensis]MCM1250635.1 radical SAM-associated putative lipoprotein [Alistipes sp.]
MKRKLYLLLLSALGFSTACSEKNDEPNQVCMYGTPRIDFRIQGKVTDRAGNPVPGIEVRNEDRSYGYGNTTLTDKAGMYDLTGSAFFTEVDLSFHDIDGAQNGGDFETETLSVKFAAEEQTAPGDDDWFNGAYVRKGADVALTEKSAPEEEE